MKVAVVTGSTRGLGYALAQALSAAEANVVVTGRTKDAVDAAVGRLGRLGHVVGVACDVAAYVSPSSRKRGVFGTSRGRERTSLPSSSAAPARWHAMRRVANDRYAA